MLNPSRRFAKALVLVLGVALALNAVACLPTSDQLVGLFLGATEGFIQDLIATAFENFTASSDTELVTTKAFTP